MPITALAAGDYSAKVTSGTYGISITGNAGTVTNGIYTNGSYSDPNWLTLSKAKVGLDAVENTSLSAWAGSANITTLGTISSGTVPWARLSNVPSTFAPSTHSHAVGDLSTVGDYSSKITSGTYSINVTGNANTLDTYHATNIANAYSHAASWTWYDPYIALPQGTSYIPPVFSDLPAAATITGAKCWSDAGDAVVQLRRSDGSDIVNGNLTCNGNLQNSMTAAAAIATTQYVGMYIVSGTAPKKIHASITYTTAY